LAIDLLHEIAAVIVAGKTVVIDLERTFEREREPAVVGALQAQSDPRSTRNAVLIKAGRIRLIGRIGRAIDLPVHLEFGIADLHLIRLDAPVAQVEGHGRGRQAEKNRACEQMPFHPERCHRVWINSL